MNIPRIFEVVARAPYLVDWSCHLSKSSGKNVSTFVEDMCSWINSGKATVIVCDSAGSAEGDHISRGGSAPPYHLLWLESIVQGPDRTMREAVSAISSRTPNGGWTVDMAHFFGCEHNRRTIYGIVGASNAALDDCGRLLPGDESWLVQRFNGKDDQLSLELIVNSMKSVLYTFAMLNCRNVTLVDGGFTDDGMTNRQKREPGRGHVSYKVLKVNVGKDREYVLGRGTSGEAANLPLHTVRGHFKTYTPERPLLGRFTGTYWWPAHARGKIENGEIRKSYEVVA